MPEERLESSRFPRDAYYNPDALIKSELELDIDAQQWAWLCQWAQDNQTRAPWIIGMLIDEFQDQMGCSDPKAKKAPRQTTTVIVRLKDIQQEQEMFDGKNTDYESDGFLEF